MTDQFNDNGWKIYTDDQYFDYVVQHSVLGCTAYRGNDSNKAQDVCAQKNNNPYGKGGNK